MEAGYVVGQLVNLSVGVVDELPDVFGRAHLLGDGLVDDALLAF